MERAFRTVSFPEKYIGLACKNTFKHVELNKKMSNGTEADIAIWDINTIIEYNGIYWHNLERDKQKREFIESKGVRLVVIYDKTASRKSEVQADIICKDTIMFNRYNRDMTPLIPVLNDMLGTQLKIDVNMEENVIELINKNIREQNLEYQYPEIAKELLYDDASKLFISDTKTREWKCRQCGTEFKTCISHRVHLNTGCPACKGNIAIPGKTDILTLLPDYAKEIISHTDDEKLHMLPFSKALVTWRCSNCGNQWQGTVVSRTLSKTACPVCRYMPIKVINNGYVDIHYLYDVSKPITEMVIDDVVYDNIDIAKAIGIIISKLIYDYDITFDNVVNKAGLFNTTNYKDKVSIDKDDFRQPRMICTIDKDNIYIEGKSSTRYKITILRELIETFKIQNVQFRIKEEQKLPNRITVAKNNMDFNVTTRINGKIKYIGRRRNVVDALKLKLSAEIYLFGNALIASDLSYPGITIESIPEFKTLDEYKKFI